MADFASRAQVATDAGFRTRVGIALTRVALRQTSEASTTPARTRKRVDLATLVLKDPAGAANRFALVLASQDVPLSIPDADLEALTVEAWDAIAGVGVEDR